jgi:hypothetical protein
LGSLLTNEGVVNALTPGVNENIEKYHLSARLPTQSMPGAVRVDFSVCVLHRFFGSAPQVCLLYQVSENSFTIK